MGKHAFLITANKNWDDFVNILSQLDDTDNDLYIHISFNSTDFNPKIVSNVIKKSSVFYLPRHRTYWGSPVVVKIIFEFLREATKRNYSYYHFLSGQDLMLVSNKTMHSFFAENKGKEFIQIWPDMSPAVHNRYAYRHPFLKLSFGNRIQRCISSVLSFPFIFFQKLFKQDKMKKYFPTTGVFWGSSFFSIDNCFAEYLCKNEKMLKKAYEGTIIPDESFLQTALMSSPYSQNVYLDKTGKASNVRLIVWDVSEKGSPHPRTFSMQYYYQIINSSNLFARKFSVVTDKVLVDKILSESRIR
jgi:hypothetical protein